MIAWLVAAAWAGDVGGVMITPQVRQDATGQVMLAGRATMYGVYGLGTTRLEGYGEAGWPGGVDQKVVPELFVLSADGRNGPVAWTIGRQRIDLPAFGRMLDGGHVAWFVNDHVQIDAWGGQARHVGLDGLFSGAPVGRVAATWRDPSFSATAGLWAEGGAAPAVHPDLRLRYLGPTKAAPDISALFAAGFGGGEAAIERARVDVSGRPSSGVRLMAYGEHREVLPGDSAIGQGILGALVPTGAVNQLGAGVGWTSATRDQVWMEGSAQAWADGAGGTAAISYRPACPAQSWCARPSWRASYGPGGVYHSLGTAVVVPMPDDFGLSVDAMVIPYHKPHADWDTALVLRTTFEANPGGNAPTLAVGGELARTALHPIDPRAWLALRWEVR